MLAQAYYPGTVKLGTMDTYKNLFLPLWNFSERSSTCVCACLLHWVPGPLGFYGAWSFWWTPNHTVAEDRLPPIFLYSPFEAKSPLNSWNCFPPRSSIGPLNFSKTEFRQQKNKLGKLITISCGNENIHDLKSIQMVSISEIICYFSRKGIDLLIYRRPVNERLTNG